ncbi:hypothetical protein P280DRAFT_258448 [Massarina eburnea CBS 473.64]|uniref:Uncharacterized protein n=1 Tax=Massarina eburnea CBS 473.64 TaxID=1395130 RepID=A0A6A6RGT1_9PLEO|nr:hypothetical protein P280DRAFT_258448 [Massarina eburnea CBS 473.64]
MIEHFDPVGRSHLSLPTVNDARAPSHPTHYITILHTRSDAGRASHYQTTFQCDRNNKHPSWHISTTLGTINFIAVYCMTSATAGVIAIHRTGILRSAQGSSHLSTT